MQAHAGLSSSPVSSLTSPVRDVRSDGRSRHSLVHDLDHVLRLRPARSCQPGARLHRRAALRQQNCQTPRRDTGICELCPGFKHSRTSCARQWRQYKLTPASERPVRPPGQALVRGCYNCGDNTHFGCVATVSRRLTRKRRLSAAATARRDTGRLVAVHGSEARRGAPVGQRRAQYGGRQPVRAALPRASPSEHRQWRSVA